MLKGNCICRIKDTNDNIMAYGIELDSGDTIMASPDNLKAGVKTGEVRIENLCLGSDFKLYKKRDRPVCNINDIINYHRLSHNLDEAFVVINDIASKVEHRLGTRLIPLRPSRVTDIGTARVEYKTERGLEAIGNYDVRLFIEIDTDRKEVRLGLNYLDNTSLNLVVTCGLNTNDIDIIDRFCLNANTILIKK